MKDKSKSDNPLIDMGDADESSRIERNAYNYFRQLDERIESMERTLNKLSHHVASFEDALTHLARIPNYPLELEYDHRTNTLWAETRRKLEFNKNEAVLLSLMFSKTTGKPKKTIFECGIIANKLKNTGDGLDNPKRVFETAKRIQKKLDDFLNTNEAIVVTTRSFYFSKNTLK